MIDEQCLDHGEHAMYTEDKRRVWELVVMSKNACIGTCTPI